MAPMRQLLLLAMASLATATPAIMLGNSQAHNSMASTVSDDIFVPVFSDDCAEARAASIVTDDVVDAPASPDTPTRTADPHISLLDMALQNLASAPPFIPDLEYSYVSLKGPQNAHTCYIFPAVDLRPYSLTPIRDNRADHNVNSPYHFGQQGGFAIDIPYHLFSQCCSFLKVMAGGWVWCGLSDVATCDQGRQCFTETVEFKVPLLDWECGGNEEEREKECARAKHEIGYEETKTVGVRNRRNRRSEL